MSDFVHSSTPVIDGETVSDLNDESDTPTRHTASDSIAAASHTKPLLSHANPASAGLAEAQGAVEAEFADETDLADEAEADPETESEDEAAVETDEAMAATAVGPSGLPLVPVDTDEAPEDGGEPVEAGPRSFSALRHRNFRLFWFGNVVSNFGTYAQITAQGWLLVTLTKDPLTITAVAACNTIPFLLLTLFAGAVADRVDKRKALIVCNVGASLLALGLGILVLLNVVQVWHVALISLLAGIVQSFDIPIRQSFNVEMVGHRDLPNAIALNSTAFNLARVVGPAIGGYLLGAIDTDGCIFVNALSFVAIICGLLFMNLPRPERARHAFKLKSLWRGIIFVRRKDTLRHITILVTVVSLLASPYHTLLPIFAKQVFRSEVGGYAMLMTYNGLGAMGSALMLAAAGRMRHRGKRLMLGCFFYCISVIGFGAAPNITIACALLIVAGWSFLTFLMTANTMVQTLSPNTVRGRVSAIYSLAVIGPAPIGAIVTGALARWMGPQLSVVLQSSLAAFFTFAVYIKARELWKEK